MIEQDTIKLLRECDEGVRMGVRSIGDVLPHVRGDALERRLTESKRDHEQLGREIRDQLDRFHDEGKDLPAMAKAMSEAMTGMKLAMNDTDGKIADIMTDGCNMGVKSLSRYLNQYAAADERSKDIAKRLIALEERLAVDLRGYL